MCIIALFWEFEKAGQTPNVKQLLLLVKCLCFAFGVCPAFCLNCYQAYAVSFSQKRSERSVTFVSAAREPIEVNLWFAALAPGASCDITRGFTVTRTPCVLHIFPWFVFASCEAIVSGTICLVWYLGPDEAPCGPDGLPLRLRMIYSLLSETV